MPFNFIDLLRLIPILFTYEIISPDSLVVCDVGDYNTHVRELRGQEQRIKQNSMNLFLYVYISCLQSVASYKTKLFTTLTQVNYNSE